MKNLKNLLGLSLISVVAFAIMGNASAATVNSISACSADTNQAYAKISSNQYSCYQYLANAVGDTTLEDGSTIVLLKDVEETVNNLVFSSDTAKNITLDLNGHSLKMGNDKAIQVTDNINLTIKNGKLGALTGATSLIVLKNTGATAGLTIAKDVTVNGTNLSHAVINGALMSKKATVNINGTWEKIDHEIMDCTASPAFSAATGTVLTLNVNAKVSGNGQIFGVDAGHTTLNITGGEYTTTTGSVINLTNGIVNIEDGKFTAEADHTIQVAQTGTDAGVNTELNIEKGTFTTTGEGKYSLYFGISNLGDFSISGGTFTSGKDGKEQLAAIGISDWDFIAKQEDIITGGKFTYAVVDDVPYADGKFYTSEGATASLVKGDYATENGVVIVGKTDTTTTDPEQTGDETTEKNPQTYDGIMSYVTLAISSLGALGFATKKVLF